MYNNYWFFFAVSVCKLSLRCLRSHSESREAKQEGTHVCLPVLLLWTQNFPKYEIHVVIPWFVRLNEEILRARVKT